MKNEIEKALKEAIRAGDNERKSALRLVLSAIKLAEVEKREPLEDAEILGVIQKEVKARREAIADAKKAERSDLVEQANADIAILEEFLPQALTGEELEAVIKEAITEVGASNPGDMGKVMKAVMPRVQGRADGGQVNQMVRQLLQGE